MKTSSNRARYKESADQVSFKKRPATWDFVIVFFLGSIYSALSGEPLSNMLFYLRMNTGVPMDPVEGVFYNIYMPVIMSGIYFGIALVLMTRTRIDPKYLLYFFIIYAGVAMVLSYYALEFNWLAMVLATIPFTIILFIVLRETRLKVGKKRYSI